MFIIQVWDVSNGGSPLHNFSGHNGRVMTCAWHPTQAGLVITGSEDGILHVWDPKEQQRKLPLERKKEKKVRRGQEPSKEAEVPSGVTVPVKEVKELSFEELLALHKSEQGKVKEVSPDPGTEVTEHAQQERVEKPRQILKPSSNRERKVKTVNKKLYFPVSSSAETKSKATALADCLAVHEYYQNHVKKDDEEEEAAVSEALDNLNLEEGDSKKKSKKEAGVHLGFFTSREAVYRLLEAERSEQAGDAEAEAVLALWSGDLVTVIEAAITEARVTERLLAHAAGLTEI